MSCGRLKRGWSSPAGEYVDPARATRFLEFLAVGTSGAVIDLVVTISALAVVHYLPANAAGFLLAVSWNFVGNWWFAFDRPDGSLPHQYVSYVGLHAVTFGVRAVVLTLLIEALGVPAVLATIATIALLILLATLGQPRRPREPRV